MRKSISVSVKLYSMLVPVLVMSVATIVVTWRSFGVNSTELIRALQMKEFAVRLHMLVIAQSDATKLMILDPENAIGGRRKIEAYDANVALLRDIAGATESALMLDTVRRLTVVDEFEIQPLETLFLEALLGGRPQLAKTLYFTQYEPARTRYEALVRRLGDQADTEAAAAARALQEKNRSSLRTISGALGIGTLAVAAILLLMTRSVQKQLQTEIDERRKTMSEVAKARDEALEASRIKSNFLANMSHEIRTPMNGLLGMTEVVLGTNLNRQQRESLEVAHQCGKGLLELLNNLLDLSKIEAGKLSHESIDFNLLPEMKRILSIFDGQARLKGVDLQWSVGEDFPQLIKSDQGKMCQVLTNLVGNAVKFTGSGSVRLHASIRKHGDGAPCVYLGVSDTGIGITAATQTRLFQPFTQGDDSTTRKYGGTGLGLAICKQLVESMGGKIGIESETGIGSLFWFTVPFVPADFTPKVERECPASGIFLGPGTRPRILVVEDNAVNQMVICRLLAQLECDTESAKTGIDAIAAYNRSHFDLVLMDCQMPEMDGYETTLAIRNRERAMRFPRTRIVALTAHALRGDRERCLEAGMDDYLTKPISRQQLLGALAAWLPERSGVTTRSS